MKIDEQLITKIASTMDVSEAYVASTIDTFINTSQPYKPIQGLCKIAKCSEKAESEVKKNG